jgi:hypothetical protein
MTIYTYDWWSRAVAGEKIGGPTLPIHEIEPQPGFYRRRISKAGRYVGVAIYENDDGALGALNNRLPADPIDVWTFCAAHPISEEFYREWERTRKWPDEDSSVTESLAPPPAGHNQGPTDEAEILEGQIEAAAKGVADYAEIKDDETAAKAQSLRSRLLELSGTADRKREALKAPHLEAGREIDSKWQPLVKAAKAAADKIKVAMGQHETRKANEASRIAREAREAEIERQRQEALKASPVTGPDVVLPIAPPPPPPAPSPASTIRGAYGRGAAVKVKKVAKVVDQDKAYLAMRGHAELVECIAKLAQRAATAGIPIDGVEVTEERVVS